MDIVGAMSEESKKRFKFIPSIKHLQTAATELPDANGFTDNEFEVKLKVGSSSGRSIAFRTIEMTVDGEKEKRWIYEGKVRV